MIGRDVVSIIGHPIQLFDKGQYERNVRFEPLLLTVRACVRACVRPCVRACVRACVPK